MKKTSLSLRLVAIFTLTAAIVWGIAGFVSYKETRESIDEFFDTYQMALGRQLAATDWHYASVDTQKATNRLIGSIKNADNDDEAIGFAVFTPEGRLVFNDNENGKNFIFGTETGKFANERIRNDDGKWRIMRLKSADGNFIIAVGQELEYREDIAMDIVEEFLAPWLIGFFVLLFAIAGLTFKEFRPLKKLAHDIGTRPADDFSPINATDAPVEIKPLLAAMNRMLKKIGELLKRERSFISDSAHELRTPLTALKIQLEIAQMAGDDSKMRDEALEKLEKGLERSAHLVEQLLALSRLEASNRQYDNEELLNWGQIISTLAEEYQEAAARKNISFKILPNSNPPFVRGNTLLTALMIRNLVDNAVKYSPNGATVTIALQRGRLEIINSGAKVDEKLLERLSERFFRPAGQKENGSGLGLAIVERIAGIYRCRLDFSNTESGFLATLSPENSEK